MPIVTPGTLPVDTPRWNTGASNRTEPTEGKKTTGWTVGEEPSSAFFNWLFFTNYEWQQWFQNTVIAMNDNGQPHFDIAPATPINPPLNSAPNDYDPANWNHPFTLWNRANLDDQAVGLDFLNGTLAIQGFRLAAQKINGSSYFFLKYWNGSGAGTMSNVFAFDSSLMLFMGASGNGGILRVGTIEANRIICADDSTVPESASTISCPNQNTAIVASIGQTSGTSTPAWTSSHWNVNIALCSRISVGYYQIVTDYELSPSALIFCQIHTVTSGLNYNAEVRQINSDGVTYINVYIHDNSSTIGSLVDSPFSLMVLGLPVAGYAPSHTFDIA